MEASPSAEWVKEEGKLVVSDSSLMDAEWASFGPPGSAFEMRVTSFPDVESREGSERSNNHDGHREYNESFVHKGRLTVATLHNRSTHVKKLYNVFFLAYKAPGNVDPDAVADIVERQLGHMPTDGKENQRRKADEKKGFTKRLVQQVMEAAEEVHNRTDQVAEGEAAVKWWLKAMFALHHRTDDDVCKQLRAMTASPIATLTFGSLVHARRLAEGREERSFLSDDSVAEMWIKNGTKTEGGMVWTEDDMIDSLFFKGKTAVLCKSPVFGQFFHMPKRWLTRVATNMDFEGMDDAASDEERNEMNTARGTADNGWTWTMSKSSESNYRELLNEKRAAAEETRQTMKERKRMRLSSPVVA